MEKGSTTLSSLSPLFDLPQQEPNPGIESLTLTLP